MEHKDILDLMKRRHSVRQYTDEPISEEDKEALRVEISAINEEGKLHFQPVFDEPQAFGGRMARYGSFTGVKNYIALVGEKGCDLDERVGYYGERLVLLAEELGLNTCWVGLHYKKVPEAFKIEKDEKLVAVIAIGHGRHRGLPRRSKTPEQVSNITPSAPEWFARGVQGALYAPTAMNQQKFYFTLHEDGSVSARASIGFYTHVDLGIAAYHFERASGVRPRYGKK